MLASSIMDDDVIVSYGDVIFDENILKPLVDFDGLIGLGIDFDWEKNYEGENKHLKYEATVGQIKNDVCVRIVDGRELKKSTNKSISSLKNSENVTIGEFVGLMRLSKNGCSVFTKTYEKIINTHTGKFHEADSIHNAYFTDMLQELIDNDVKILPISVLIIFSYVLVNTLQPFFDSLINPTNSPIVTFSEFFNEEIDLFVDFLSSRPSTILTQTSFFICPTVASYFKCLFSPS